jgi:hypothetical protein
MYYCISGRCSSTNAKALSVPDTRAFSLSFLRITLVQLISFEKCFKRNLGDESTANAIVHMDQARFDMAQEMASGNPNYQNTVAGAERYIPLISQTLYSLEQVSHYGLLGIIIKQLICCN